MKKAITFWVTEQQAAQIKEACLWLNLEQSELIRKGIEGLLRTNDMIFTNPPLKRGAKKKKEV